MVMTTARSSRATEFTEWTRDDELAALRALRRAAEGPEPRPVVLGYGRQSESEFDKDGNPKGPSLDQQRETTERRPEFAGLRVEWYSDADIGGGAKDLYRRGGYHELRERIRSAAPGEIGAVAFYVGDRLNRNDVEHFQFMAEMEERRILVFDQDGLIFNSDKVSWKVKAIIAQDARENIARKVRNNLAYLKRHGHLLGTIPQGYMRDARGEVVEDPEAGAIVRMIFDLYATGRYTFRTLAEHLNTMGVKPARGPKKENHRRPQAVIFTADVVKDIIKSRVYLGLARLSRWRTGPEEWIEGRHPALVTQETWDACQTIRLRNRRRTSNTWTRRSYPLTPVLRCKECGGTMYGEAKVKGTRERLLYACRCARSRSAVNPSAGRCTAPRLPAPMLEDAVRGELGRCVVDADAYIAYRQELERLAGAEPTAPDVIAAAVRRLNGQLSRLLDLYEMGERTREEFVAKRDHIKTEIARLEEQAQRRDPSDLLGWCRSQVLDLLAAWDAADLEQQRRLLSSIFQSIEVEAQPGGGLLLVGVPVEAWRPFFEGVGHQRETGLEPATSTLGRLHSTVELLPLDGRRRV